MELERECEGISYRSLLALFGNKNKKATVYDWGKKGVG